MDRETKERLRTEGKQFVKERMRYYDQGIFLSPLSPPVIDYGSMLADFVEHAIDRGLLKPSETTAVTSPDTCLTTP